MNTTTLVVTINGTKIAMHEAFPTFDPEGGELTFMDKDCTIIGDPIPLDDVASVTITITNHQEA